MRRNRQLLINAVTGQVQFAMSHLSGYVTNQALTNLRQNFAIGRTVKNSLAIAVAQGVGQLESER